jgi:hypothetical protein
MATDTLTTSPPQNASTKAKKQCRVVPFRSSLQLVGNKPDAQVVEVLETLLTGAKRGEVTGIAFVATLKGMSYITDVAGMCQKHPTFTRGIVAALDDELAGIVFSTDVNGIR